MIVLMDTSSLLAFVRYYIPFDKNGTLLSIMESKYLTGELQILDKVFLEAKYTGGGIILKEIPFLENKKLHIKTDDLIPPPKFYNLIENQFCNKIILKARGINDAEFEVEKSRFLHSADLNLVLYALLNRTTDPIIVTEETENSNDNKLFKKIPANCKEINISCCTLPFLFKEHFKMDFNS